MMDTPSYPIDHVFGPDDEGRRWRRHRGVKPEWQVKNESMWRYPTLPEVFEGLLPLLAPLSTPQPSVQVGDGVVWRWTDPGNDQAAYWETPEGERTETGSALYEALTRVFALENNGNGPGEDTSAPAAP